VSKSSSGYSERKKPQPEISSEKKRFAASLFGGPTPSGRVSGSAGAKAAPVLVWYGAKSTFEHTSLVPVSGITMVLLHHTRAARLLLGFQGQKVGWLITQKAISFTISCTKFSHFEKIYFCEQREICQ